MIAMLKPVMRGASVLALGALATACASGPPRAEDGRLLPTFADTYRIKVAQIGERLELPLRAEGLSEADTRSLATFAQQYRAIGRGPMTVSLPTSADPAAAQPLRAALAEEGVLVEAISLTTYDSTDPKANAVLSYSHFTAEAPTCPGATDNLAASHTNAPPSNFGCATASNLAALVADPGDLAGPRALDAADATRRAVVLERYRAGQQTHAARSEDERVTLSRVAK